MISHHNLTQIINNQEQVHGQHMRNLKFNLNNKGNNQVSLHLLPMISKTKPNIEDLKEKGFITNHSPHNLHLPLNIISRINLIYHPINKSKERLLHGELMIKWIQLLLFNNKDNNRMHLLLMTPKSNLLKSETTELNNKLLNNLHGPLMKTKSQ